MIAKPQVLLVAAVAVLAASGPLLAGGDVCTSLDFRDAFLEGQEGIIIDYTSPGGDLRQQVRRRPRSGIIVSVDKLKQWPAETVRTVAHEIIHALMDRGTWTPSTNEHTEASGVALAATNIMSVPASRGRWATNDDQCLNINTDVTIFRGDP